jgi:hypothetical protein
VVLARGAPVSGEDGLAKRAGNWKAIAGVLFAVFVAGATLTGFSNRFALVADIAKQHREVIERIERSEMHAIDMDKRTSVVEALLMAVRDELRWQRAQQVSTAKRVGARVVPEPKE